MCHRCSVWRLSAIDSAVAPVWRLRALHGAGREHFFQATPAHVPFQMPAKQRDASQIRVCWGPLAWVPGSMDVHAGSLHVMDLRCGVPPIFEENWKGHAPSAFPEAKAPICQLIEALSQQAQGIPVVQHLAPRRTKAGTLDLTSSTLFVRDIAKHALICEYARNLNVLIPFRHGSIHLGVALRMLLRALHDMHALWSQKTQLSPSDLERAGFGRQCGCMPEMEWIWND